ncbi:MAG: hypothetical protein J0H63_11405, partial [Rhizobiales bacterium]|nr:hypothetical protein [Hyphomicrobiales bacterium]
MPDKLKPGVDRRAFMIASMAAVGASAAVAAGTGSAEAEDSGAAANPAGTGTAYTGDVIEGKKVVSALDVGDLEPGKTHFLYFRGVEMPTGQHWHVSVRVAKGVTDADLESASEYFSRQPHRSYYKVVESRTA